MAKTDTTITINKDLLFSTANTWNLQSSLSQWWIVFYEVHTHSHILIFHAILWAGKKNLPWDSWAECHWSSDHPLNFLHFATWELFPFDKNDNVTAWEKKNNNNNKNTSLHLHFASSSFKIQHIIKDFHSRGPSIPYKEGKIIWVF